MMKKISLALMCIATLAMFTACENNNQNNGKSPEGQWITSPEQLEGYVPNDSINDCYQFDVWCDGTTIGREYMWTNEALVIFMIKQMQAAELKAYGEYRKKYKYEKVEEPTEEACTSRQWEGAECWLETITYPNSNGETVSNQEYLWMPEANVIERHNYYMARLEQIGVFNHEYERAPFDDKDACLANNPEDTTMVDPGQKFCWKITMTVYETGSTETIYMWLTQAEMDAYVDGLAGYASVNAELSAADDEDACMAKNM